MKNNKNIEDKPFEVCLYLKIFGLAADNNGKKEYAYIKMELGNSKVVMPYSEVVKLIDLSKVANTFSCDISDITIITKGEYERECGE